MNLLKETKTCLKANGLDLNDIEWIGNEKYQIPIVQFIELANREYDDGYGAAHVCTDLMIVGSDWWMTRGEYDGSEWWNFHRKPIRPDNIKDVGRLIGGMWPKLEDYIDNKV